MATHCDGLTVVRRIAQQWCTLFDMRVAVFTTRDLDVDGMVGFTAVIIQILSDQRSF